MDALQHFRRRPDAGCILHGYRLCHLSCDQGRQIVYGIGCGLITMFIRYFGSYAEGVSYAILIMNIAVLLLDKIGVPKRFGYVKPGKEAAK